MSEKIYRVQMNSKGMPNFSTAEEIIRCGECRAYDSECKWCGGLGLGMNPDDFCSYGERKTESTGSPIGDYRDGVGAWQTEREGE